MRPMVPGFIGCRRNKPFPQATPGARKGGSPSIEINIQKVLSSLHGPGSSFKLFRLAGLRVLSFEFLVFSSNGSNSKLRIKCFYSQGSSMPKSRQIFLARKGLTSVWRGTAERRLSTGFSHHEWFAPSRTSRQPCAARWRMSSRRFTPESRPPRNRSARRCVHPRG